MKECPHCHRTYADDTLVFCTADGNKLVRAGYEPETPTVVLNKSQLPPAEVTNVVPARKAGSAFKYIALGLGAFFLLCLGGAIALWMMWPRSDRAASNQVISSAPPSTNLNVQPDNTKTPLKNANSSNTEPVKPRPSPSVDLPSTDPGTTRIAFARGKVGQTVQGSVVKQRMFVLRTGLGQDLSANVRGTGGCVAFSNGSSTMNHSTEEGDTFVTVVNKCDTPTKFTLNVTVR